MTIALLIDADNVSASRYPEILRRALAMGEVPIRRAFFSGNRGDWAQIAGLRPCLAGAGKNSADLLMTIEAMELALRGKVERFVLASSDSDFSHLALRLREYGLEVVGMGGPQASHRFREACTGFQVLSGVEPLKQAVAKAEPMPIITTVSKPLPQPSQKPKDMPTAIEQEVGRLLTERGGKVPIADLNAEVRKRIGVNISTQPEKTWRAYLRKRPHLFAVDPKGPEACVKRLS